MKTMILVVAGVSGCCLVGAGVVVVGVWVYHQFFAPHSLHDTYYTFRFGPLSFTPSGIWSHLFMIGWSVALVVCGAFLLRWASALIR